MKNINVLPPSVYNLLAAGEVVENPAAIVKECVENSLDAGATKIDIEIVTGGLELIKITDNGHGVSIEQIDKVFVPHATSKIENKQDLESISTLGFRGEALASIAAVTQTVFISKTKEQSVATKIVIEGGTVNSKQSIAGNVGTTISMANLFYNTPARKKFLASNANEKLKVTAVVHKFILSNPTINFKYIVDNEVIIDYKGKTLLDAIKTVYNGINPDDLLYIKAQNEKFSLAGYLSNTNLYKRNRTYQNLMVNGRAIEGGEVASIINEIYSNYLPISTFPFFVLNLKIDFGNVDVNIHPRKSQVKFSNTAELTDFINEAISNRLDNHLHTKNTSNFDIKNDNEILEKIKHFSSTPKASEVQSVQSAPNIMNRFDLREEKARLEQQKVQIPSKVKQTSIPLVKDNFEILGTIFDTYILIAQGHTFVIIDQHAAAERLLYDQLKKQVDEGNVATQTLLEPIILALTPLEMLRMETLIPYLNDMGIECSAFGGNTLRITAIPVLVTVHGMDTIINSILLETKNIPVEKISNILKDKLITQCCKNSIKAGQPLNHAQIRSFLQSFAGGVNKPTCPHGRPILINFSKDQIAKLFLRK